jgi:alpha-1,2-mannosyltransferase
MRSNLVSLSRLDRVLLLLFALAMVGFGVVVEKRSAFMSRRMGDLGCFLRAGWAVRTGHDIYDVIDDNDWHYNYPPAFAIAVAPLADPPPGQDATGFLPYPISVAIFYIGGVLLLFAGVHRFASALEETSTDPTFRAQTPHHRRWWALRIVPILVCLVPIGTTLGKGQVNTLILFLLASTGADWLRGKSFRGGLTLAVAIVIKVIPIYLLVLPMKNRDGRALAGCGLGLFLGLVAMPLCVWSPAETWNVYAKYGQVFVGPLLHLGGDSSRTDELLGTNGTDSVSLKTALHHWTYPDWNHRPAEQPAIQVVLYALVGILVTAAILWPRRRETWTPALQWSALLASMTIFAPITHQHYVTFCVPLVMLCLAQDWSAGRSIGRDTALACGLVLATTIVPTATGWFSLRDCCLALGGLAALTCVGLWRLQGTGFLVRRMGFLGRPVT